MNYYKARMYSPTLGRFMQTDPIGYEDNVNLYGYVGNDPINGVDPTGECGVNSEGDKVGICGEDTAAANLLSAQMSNPKSRVTEANDKAMAQGVMIPVTTVPDASNSNASLDGAEIGLGPQPIVVSDIGSNETYEMDASLDELVEHEIGEHINEQLDGPIPDGTGVIDASGFVVDISVTVTMIGPDGVASTPSTGNRGQSEANAVNGTNRYRRDMGRRYQRVTY